MPRVRPCRRRWPWALALVLQLGWAREESALPNTKVFTLQELRCASPACHPLHVTSWSSAKFLADRRAPTLGRSEKRASALALAGVPGVCTEMIEYPDPRVSAHACRMYNGSNAAWPILIAINGSVFDVSNGTKFYYPGKAYAKFAGRDVTRNTALFSTEDRDLDRTDYPPDREAYLRSKCPPATKPSSAAPAQVSPRPL